MPQDNLARKLDYDDDNASGAGIPTSSGASQSTPSRLTGKEGNVLYGDFGGGAQAGEGEQQPEAEEGEQSQELQQQPASDAPIQIDREKAKEYYQKQKAKRQQDPLAEKDSPDLKEKPKTPSGASTAKTGAVADKAAKTASEGAKVAEKGAETLAKASDQAGKAGGTAGNIAKVGKAAATLADSSKSGTEKAKEIALDAGTAIAGEALAAGTADVLNLTRQNGKIYVVILEFIKIRLLWLLIAIAALQAFLWMMALVFMFVAAATLCEATDYKIFGYKVGHNALGLVSNIDVAGICKPLQDAMGSLIAGGYVPGVSNTGPITSSGCSPNESGGCTKETINQCPGMARNMEGAIRACNQESAGGQVSIASGTDKCQLPDGGYVSFSIGLWQINMLDSTQPEFPECKDALILTGRDPKRCVTRDSKGNCIVTYRSCKYGPQGAAGYAACRSALSDPKRNTRQACRLFNDRGWQPWPHTRKVCGLP